MNEFSIIRLRRCLQQLVLYQKANRDVYEILKELKKIIEGRTSSCFSVPKEERLLCQAEILVALRIGADTSMTTGRWSNDRTGYASVVHACLSLHEDDNEQPSLGFVKFSHIHALFSALLTNMDGPSDSILILLQAVHDLCRTIMVISEWKNGFLCAKYLALYGKVISVCLEVAADKENDIRCRQLALRSLEIVVNISEENNESLCVVLPGLSTTLVTTACASNEHLDIVISCLKILSKAVPICLCDYPRDDSDVSPPLLDLHPEIPRLLIQRNCEWKTKTCANVVKMVRTLCSTLAMHRDELVRSTLLQVLDLMRNQCLNIFDGSLDAFLFDLIVTIPGNEALKSEIIHRLRSEKNSTFSIHLHGKLRELSERIPLYVQRGTEGSGMLLQQLANVISCISEDVSRLAASRSPVLRSIFPALAASLRVDLRRLCISHGQFGGSSLELVKSLPFSFGIDICSILPICATLADYGGVEVVELAFSEMVDSDRDTRASLAIVITLIVAELKAVEDPYVVFSLAETCTEWLSEFRPKEHARDDIIECKIPVATNETVLTIGLVSLLAIAFRKITEEKKQLKLLIAFLYQLLELYAIPNWIVHDAADCALNEISKAFSQSVSEFLYDRGTYLIHQIALAAQSRKEHDHAPIVFSALLDRVDNQEMFHHVRYIVEDLLQALDRHMQEYCILILRSMLSFVSAVGRWFSGLKPLEEEEPEKDDGELLTEEQAIMEVEKKPPPLPITSVENDLLRTTHLLSSSHLPIRILVLKILREGLWVLRNFDDSLLPTIHRNWEALIHRFNDEELEVRQECAPDTWELSTTMHIFLIFLLP
ncbi:hypothetical protein KIN20_034601 [Parelaphostrongylus tenuis]|uniref:TTI1 C-terminal TPR domain-containing protein n=1 Tax=Parelaphostrongylus tenuis TaxID=148309 RepID=A0AAD5RAE5_PARTN|nr:hypothetical protein KIN20_034601 [Parelaphostrongylus tenuis]